MSDTNRTRSQPADTQTTDDEIGIYYVPAGELAAPPEERTYQRKALWTPQGWSSRSDGEIVEDAPAERTIAAFRRRWRRSRNYFVYPPDEVPGQVEVSSPEYTISDLGLDEEIVE